LLGIAQFGYAQPSAAPGNLLASSRHARLEVIRGRIRLSGIQLGRQSLTNAKFAGSDAQEQLVFASDKFGDARLSYVYTDPTQQLLVDIQEVADVTIARQPQGGADVAGVRLRQPVDGPLVLTVEDGGPVREVVAASLWHLLLAEPELCKLHLLPLLESLRPDWILGEQVQHIESALLTAARLEQLPDTQRMEQLIQQLRHPQFSQRQAADRQLRQLGQAACAFLSRLDERSLDVEQRTRVRSIQAALEIQAGDTPPRVAAWLADDRSVWLSLLERDSVATRQLAARHLGALLDQSLAFDPQADAAVRRGQLHRLRAELGLVRPVLAAGPRDTQTR
jgi:hypothetical protein